jgi:hypothetical protein
LKHVSLDAKPQYEALSYVWGGLKPTRFVYCDGKQVRIRLSLYEALESLRLPDRERVLWADAICINQGDNVEKGKQVMLMSRIYESTEQVLIWLGKPTQETEGALNALKEVDAYLKLRSRLYRKSPRYRPLLRSLHRPFFVDLDRTQMQELQRFDWSAIFTMLRHPWPTRVWTAQEFAKAPRALFVHGNQSLPSDQFFGPLMDVTGSPMYNEFFAHLVGSGAAKMTVDVFVETGLRGNDLGRFQPGTLFNTVATGAFLREATNPRDKIYGFLSLAHDFDGTDWELSPDYSASVEAVYSRFARWCLLKKKDLRYLSYAGLPDYTEFYESGDFPSWVADWTMAPCGKNEHSNLTKNGYSASAGSEPTISWMPNQPRVLNIKGRVFDTVDELSVSRYYLNEYGQRNMDASGRLRRELASRSFRKLLKPGHEMKLYAESLLEAQSAIDRFGSDRVPSHALTDVVWMEQCKQIASGDTNGMAPARFEEFWRVMARDRTEMGHQMPPKDFGTTFAKYTQLLADVHEGNRTVSALSGTAHSVYEHKIAAASRGRRFYPQRSRFMTAPATGPVLDSRKELEMRQLMHVYWSGVMFRRFCCTSQGRLGWVPMRAEPGDLVCILDGATVPYVLRPKTEQESRGKLSLAHWRERFVRSFSSERVEKSTQYTLVGECYVHGIMEGEAMARDDLDVKVFALS